MRRASTGGLPTLRTTRRRAAAAVGRLGLGARPGDGSDVRPRRRSSRAAVAGQPGDQPLPAAVPAPARAAHVLRRLRRADLPGRARGRARAAGHHDHAGALLERRTIRRHRGRAAGLLLVHVLAPGPRTTSRRWPSVCSRCLRRPGVGRRRLDTSRPGDGIHDVGPGRRPRDGRRGSARVAPADGRRADGWPTERGPALAGRAAGERLRGPAERAAGRRRLARASRTRTRPSARRCTPVPTSPHLASTTRRPGGSAS